MVRRRRILPENGFSRRRRRVFAAAAEGFQLQSLRPLPPNCEFAQEAEFGQHGRKEERREHDGFRGALSHEKIFPRQ